MRVGAGRFRSSLEDVISDDDEVDVAAVTIAELLAGAQLADDAHRGAGRLQADSPTDTHFVLLTGPAGVAWQEAGEQAARRLRRQSAGCSPAMDARRRAARLQEATGGPARRLGGTATRSRSSAHTTSSKTAPASSRSTPASG
jgi:hypothetical protein